MIAFWLVDELHTQIQYVSFLYRLYFIATAE